MLCGPPGLPANKPEGPSVIASCGPSIHHEPDELVRIVVQFSFVTAFQQFARKNAPSEAAPADRATPCKQNAVILR